MLKLKSIFALGLLSFLLSLAGLPPAVKMNLMAFAAAAICVLSAILGKELNRIKNSGKIKKPDTFTDGGGLPDAGKEAGKESNAEPNQT